MTGFINAANCAVLFVQVVLVLDRDANSRATPQSYLMHFKGRRKTLTLKDVQRIAKAVARESRVDANDVRAVEELIKRWGGAGAEDGPVLVYQPQVTP